jgi:signal transduction histidine kinase/DNA-binding response OmpR family regulator
MEAIDEPFSTRRQQALGDYAPVCSAGAPSGTGQVLFVCDRPGNDPVVATVSSELGQVLVRVHTLGQAIAATHIHDFALILVGYDGDPAALLDAVRRLHAARRASHTPIVVLGIPAAPPFPLEQAYEAGAIAVLSEPLSPTILKAKARFYLDAFATAAERRRAEEALVDSRARLESTIAAAELAIWSWDVAADRLEGDQRLASLFGMPPAADAAPAAVYIAALHPDDIAPTRRLLTLSAATGAPFDATFRVRSGSGWRWLVSRGQVDLYRDGQAARMRGVVIDANRQMDAEEQLRASEQRYRTLFEAIDEGVCVIEVLFDADDKPCDYVFLETNPAFIHHTGLDDAIGKRMRELAPQHETYWFELYGRVAHTGEPMRFVSEAAALGRWYDVYAMRFGPAGCNRVVVTFYDITERRRSEDALRRLAADLAETDRQKTQFLATLAHELRNPLAPIRNGLHLLRRAGHDEARRERVQDIVDRQVDQLVHLVDDLLDVARITRGHIELKRAWIDLGDVMRCAVETSRPLLEAAGHRFELALTAQPLALYADPVRLTQVLGNLLNNAAKYTPSGGTVALSAESDGVDALVVVADNGIGIAPGQLEAVFDMFAQVGGGAQQIGHGGLGIGLSLARSLVHLHGGEIRAQSGGPDRGSRFTIRLPLAPPDAPPRQHPGDCVRDAAETLRVLVVDDNRDAAETLAALLDLMGHAAPVANDGPQALRLMAEIRPHVVFLDLGMPGMSGYEVAARIRREPRYAGVKLVALTGWGGPQDRERTASAGFDAHLTKPAALDAIEAVLASV